VSGDGCDANCTPTACGNGVVTAGEECDDGNVAACDGCSPRCQLFDACVDEFLCYQALPTLGSAPLTPVLGVPVVDQFAPRSFDLTALKQICTPSAAGGDGTIDPATYLAVYRARAPSGTPSGLDQVNIGLRDAFGTFRVDAVRPSRLLVPAGMDLSADPVPPDSAAHGLDHLACYRVRVSRGVARFGETQASVADRFTSTPRRLDVKRPKLLCIPASVRGGEVERADRYVMCYSAVPAAGEPAHVPQVGLFVHDEFGRHRLDTRKEELLCVPAERLP
jgi:cysteine-rich repeat protein